MAINGTKKYVGKKDSIPESNYCLLSYSTKKEKEDEETYIYYDKLKQLKLKGNCKKVFLSYSYDNKKHTKWVRKLAYGLIDKGIYVILDQFQLKLGASLNEFMKESIKNADRVICILTPRYKQRAETDKNSGVGVEYSLITKKLLKNKKTTKFIPLIRKGRQADSLPEKFRDRNFIDFRNDLEYSNKFNDLVRDILY